LILPNGAYVSEKSSSLRRWRFHRWSSRQEPKAGRLLGPRSGPEISGLGEQTRSFFCIDECVGAMRRLMKSSFPAPLNIGSEEMVTINQIADIFMRIAGKKLTIRHISGPTGVRSQNSDNALIRAELGWEPNCGYSRDCPGPAAGLKPKFILPQWSNQQLRGSTRRKNGIAPSRIAPGCQRELQ
jgi:hypothetical protein